jgi:hypothetical protein
VSTDITIACGVVNGVTVIVDEKSLSIVCPKLGSVMFTLSSRVWTVILI